MKTLIQYIKESDNTQINAFVILKPEFLSHEDDFLSMLKNNGWQIVQKQTLQLTHEQAQELYKMHKDKKFYEDLCKYMSSDKCMCCTCHKSTDKPIEEMNKIKDKIRNAWGKSEMKNAMHSSDSIENVNRERKIIFD